MKTHSQKFLQQRRFFTALPLLVIPFLTLLFWALGGGKGISAEAKGNEPSGLNLELPKAYFTDEDENWNKFALYEKAKKDSLKYLQERKNDPYYQVDYLTDASVPDEKQIEAPKKGRLNSSLNKGDRSIDPNEEKVNQKLEQLYRELDYTSTSSPKVSEADYSTTINDNDQFAADVDRLEQMMLMMQESGPEDPEMQQIENVLEKILDIQYPERVKQRMKEQALKDQAHAFSVETNPGQVYNSSLDDDYMVAASFGQITYGRNAFYGLEDDPAEASNGGNAIEAVIHETQELVRGSTVKMRLLNDIYINGQLVPRGQFIYGTCNINNERLKISIESIRSKNNLLPVSLEVYDLDGLPGIYIPGAITDDIARQTTNQTLQDLDFYSFDPSVSAQVANAGIQATKSLLSKKAKEIKVTVKAGYKILLKDSRSHS